MRQEFYKQKEDGSIVFDYAIEDGIAEALKEGEVVLVPAAGGARKTVYTSYAGQFITLQREQSSTANMGNIAILNVIDGQSFEIRSTNASDAGTIKWKFIEE